MPNVPVVMLVAAAAVLIGVIAVALGRGGELTYFPADYAPIRLDKVSATDVVLFRPPLALWGYNAQATDEALNRIADALTERDIEIGVLRQQVESLRDPVDGSRFRDELDGPDGPGGPGAELSGRGPGESSGTGWAGAAGPRPGNWPAPEPGGATSGGHPAPEPEVAGRPARSGRNEEEPGGRAASASGAGVSGNGASGNGAPRDPAARASGG